MLPKRVMVNGRTPWFLPSWLQDIVMIALRSYFLGRLYGSHYQYIPRWDAIRALLLTSRYFKQITTEIVGSLFGKDYLDRIRGECKTRHSSVHNQLIAVNYCSVLLKYRPLLRRIGAFMYDPLEYPLSLADQRSPLGQYLRPVASTICDFAAYLQIRLSPTHRERDAIKRIYKKPCKTNVPIYVLRGIVQPLLHRGLIEYVVKCKQKFLQRACESIELVKSWTQISLARKILPSIEANTRTVVHLRDRVNKTFGSCPRAFKDLYNVRFFSAMNRLEELAKTAEDDEQNNFCRSATASLLVMIEDEKEMYDQYCDKNAAKPPVAHTNGALAMDTSEAGVLN
ncbi:hypothetical protein EVG20_g4611 [Dentipellis fragilis]|uniref:Uncharacterized protein n=1 Tax=Dentipellis fragilis TaxID=205917 RepID=A0A4Y9YXJ9_9AGAM|nr:hypothetical protein EVG20_g4611 [Dentipellis fragilis]